EASSDCLYPTVGNKVTVTGHSSTLGGMPLGVAIFQILEFLWSTFFLTKMTKIKLHWSVHIQEYSATPVAIVAVFNNFLKPLGARISVHRIYHEKGTQGLQAMNDVKATSITIYIKYHFDLALHEPIIKWLKGHDSGRFVKMLLKIYLLFLIYLLILHIAIYA
ncbi:hypothetical protein ACJX0J_017960, partial [Zea mays]